MKLLVRPAPGALVADGIARMLTQFRSDQRVVAKGGLRGAFRLGGAATLERPAFYDPPTRYWSADALGDTPSFADALLPTTGDTALQSSTTGVTLEAGTTPRGGNAFRFHGGQLATSLHVPLPLMLQPPFTIAMWVRLDAQGLGGISALLGATPYAPKSIFLATSTSSTWGGLTSTNQLGSFGGGQRPFGDWAWLVLRSTGTGFYEWIADAVFTPGPDGPNDTMEQAASLGTGIVFGIRDDPTNGIYQPMDGAMADIAYWDHRLDDGVIADAYAWIQVAPFAKRPTGALTGTASGAFHLTGGLATSDPYFANVVFLAHMDTSSFVDTTGRHALAGNTGVTTTPGLYGNAALCPGGANGLRYASNSDFNLSGDFTLEFTVLTSAFSTNQAILSSHQPGVGISWQADLSPTGYVEWYTTPAGGNAVIDTAPIALNTPTRYAITQSGNTTRLYREGVLVATNTSSPPAGDGSVRPLGVGGTADSSAYGLHGWVDEVRITKGVARFTGASYSLDAAPFFNS